MIRAVCGGRGESRKAAERGVARQELLGLAGNRRQQAERKRVQRVAICAQQESVCECAPACVASGLQVPHTHTQTHRQI